MDEPRRRGRPRLTEEEKAIRAEQRRNGELVSRPRSDLQQNLEQGDNARYLQHAMEIRSMPAIDIANPKEVEARIDTYFKLCIQDDMKPTVKGLCNALRIAKTTLWCWKTGNHRAGTHEEVIMRAYDVLEALWEDYMMNGKINPMSGVFLGINNYGYKDVKQVNVTPVVDTQPEIIDLATLEAKYAELPDD